VDENGTVTGLITMEDLLECIFGDLPSASDLNAATPSRVAAVTSGTGEDRE
jgi:CBS domain containing-hemolysin-like protein